MQARGKYRTKQYDELLSYIRTIPGKHFTVNDIHLHFASRGRSIGTATLYRQLDRMVEEGAVNKYIIDAKSAACYEYVAHDDQKQQDSHYHFRCKVCGKLMHISCHHIHEMQEHFLQDHHFQIDPMRTVFYGTCEGCLSSGRGEARAKSKDVGCSDGKNQ